MVVPVGFMGDVLVLIIVEGDRLGTGGHRFPHAVRPVGERDDGISILVLDLGQAVFGVVDVGALAVIGQVAVVVVGVILSRLRPSTDRHHHRCK